MKAVWIVLIGIAAAVVYGIVSHAITGAWNFSLAFVIGVVVALALSGFRARPVGGGTGAVPSPRQNGEAASAPVQNARSVSVPEPPTSTAFPQGQPSAAIFSATPSPNANTTLSQPSIVNLQPAFQPPSETAEDLWNRARVMVHNVIPDLEEDAEYLNLVTSAAERGYIPALAKLGDYAFRRGAFVEAYFWTKLAHRRLELSENADLQGLKEISDMLRNIRREWSIDGQPLEYENVYANFPEERGELGRAFLRLDTGSEVKQTRDYIQFLAQKGNPDAALFV